jgi:hypothetical protein
MEPLAARAFAQSLRLDIYIRGEEYQELGTRVQFLKIVGYCVR